MKATQTTQSNNGSAPRQFADRATHPAAPASELTPSIAGEPLTYTAATQAGSRHSSARQSNTEHPSEALPGAELCDRLIPLCDGRPGLRATLQIQAQSDAADQNAPGGPLPVIDFVSSDATLDRYDEIISPAGWRLDNYRRNPVFQNAHQYGDIIFTLGKALITELRTTPFPHLFQRIEFAVDVNPMARIAYGLYKNKFLNAVSVGFIPIRWENADGTIVASGVSPDVEAGVPLAGTKHSRPYELTPPGKMPGSTAGVTPAATARRIYLEQELLEVSAVGIPANPEALQLGLESGAIERADLKSLLELLVANADRTPHTQPTRDSIIPHPPSTIHDTHHPSSHNRSSVTLFQLARALRDLLRRT